MRMWPFAGAATIIIAVGLLLRDVPLPDATAPPPVMLGELLEFPGATDWRAASCAEASCTGEWVHVGGQRVQVLLVPVPDPTRLTDLATRLQQRVVADGGRADRIDQAGGVLRMLRPAVVDGVESVVFSYVIPAPDRRALHLVNSTVATEAQIAGDERLRDLLAFAAWVQPAGPTTAGRRE
jgi:hypothetical protein